jgi:hypothetical protein
MGKLLLAPNFQLKTTVDLQRVAQVEERQTHASKLRKP